MFTQLLSEFVDISYLLVRCGDYIDSVDLTEKLVKVNLIASHFRKVTYNSVDVNDRQFEVGAHEALFEFVGLETTNIISVIFLLYFN